MNNTHTTTKYQQETDLKFLEIASAGDTILMKKIIRMFLEKTEIRMREIARYIDLNKWEKVRDLAHTAKSSYSSVGAKNVSSALEKMEYNAGPHTKHQMQVIFSDILDANKIIQEELQSFLNGTNHEWKQH